jgi:hypothetical protein
MAKRMGCFWKGNVMEDVTQADREAAAANILARLIQMHGGEQQWMDASTQSMRLGEQDNHWEVQAFAAHRRASVAALEAENARLRDLLCLADELLMVTIGAFPLPGNPLREKVKLIRDVTGSDYNARKAGAARAALAGKEEA